MRQRWLLIGLVWALGGCGSSSTGTAGTTAATPSSSSTQGSAQDGHGVVAGVPFAAGAAFAQYDPTQRVWWIVLAAAGHTCSSSQMASAAVPDVNASFPARRPSNLPPSTPETSVGITFEDRSGYPTTLNGGGVSITVARSESTTGGHWTGTINVPEQSTFGKSYGFKGSFAAVVCPPVS